MKTSKTETMATSSLKRTKFKTGLKRIAHHPALTLITGIGLFLTGLSEALETIFVDFESVVETHNAIILLGLVQILRAIAEMVESAEWFSDR
ncbi:MAG TPA: hypothetical protein EYQ50_10205 [Verrucomicrobiales bacterium]|nr:hypothetical protein [Verrucomicrobiales bacterium]HIL70291.1 hypothetical protein [Verrucomicrobiota bacterium]